MFINRNGLFNNGNSNFYHTKFPKLADALIETMEGNIHANSGWSLMQSSKDAKALECSRSTNMIAILNILKKGLRPTEKEPLHEEDKMMLVFGLAAIKHMGVKVREIALPKMIELSKDRSGLTEGFYIDSSLGNKVFQDNSRGTTCYVLSQTLDSYKDLLTAANEFLMADVEKTISLKDKQINVGALNNLLNEPEYAKKLKAPLMMRCMRQFRKDSFVGMLNKDIYEIIRKMVICDMKAELFGRINEIMK